MASRKTKRVRRTGVVLALGLSGCGVEHAAGQPQQEPTAPAAVVTDWAGLNASVQQSLDRLNALQLFTVDQLVMKLPANATGCYGSPCDADGQTAYGTELARQAARLSKLADQAESCNSGHCYMFETNSAEEAVQALNALEIVQVGSLLVAQPQNNPSCYNLPCESDVQAANAENRRRATKTLTIATYAKGI